MRVYRHVSVVLLYNQIALYCVQKWMSWDLHKHKKQKHKNNIEHSNEHNI